MPISEITKCIKADYERYLVVTQQLKNALVYDLAKSYAEQIKILFFEITSNLHKVKGLDKNEYNILFAEVIPELKRWKTVIDDNLLRLNENYDRDRGEDL